MDWWREEEVVEGTCFSWVCNVPCPGENKICFLSIFDEETSPEEAAETLRSVLALADSFLLCETGARETTLAAAREILEGEEKSAQIISTSDPDPRSYLFRQAQENDLAQGADYLLWLDAGDHLSVGLDGASPRLPEEQDRERLLKTLEVSHFPVVRIGRRCKVLSGDNVVYTTALARNDRRYFWGKGVDELKSDKECECGKLVPIIHIVEKERDQQRYFGYTHSQVEKIRKEGLLAEGENEQKQNQNQEQDQDQGRSLCAEKTAAPALDEKARARNAEAYLALGNGMLVFDRELAARSFIKALREGSSEVWAEAERGLALAGVRRAG